MACENVYTGGGRLAYHDRREFVTSLPPAKQPQPGPAPHRAVEGELLPHPVLMVMAFANVTYVCAYVRYFDALSMYTDILLVSSLIAIR